MPSDPPDMRCWRCSSCGQFAAPPKVAYIEPDPDWLCRNCVEPAAVDDWDEENYG